MKQIIVPTGHEVFFDENDLIVSKTDVRGRITYANREFCRVARYSAAQLLGQPHSIIRHPDMPRVVFKLLWDTIAQNREIFAYVKNMSAVGDHYWVFVHVKPTFDQSGSIIGYHSSRRVPRRRSSRTRSRRCMPKFFARKGGTPTDGLCSLPVSNSS